jgi:hypothetical protein
MPFQLTAVISSVFAAKFPSSNELMPFALYFLHLERIFRRLEPAANRCPKSRKPACP